MAIDVWTYRETTLGVDLNKAMASRDSAPRSNRSSCTMPRMPLLAPKSPLIVSRWRRASSMTPQALELMTAVGPPDCATTALPRRLLMVAHLTTGGERLPYRIAKNH